ncbi:MAG TPA: EpsD family peptidyl-prolyl cis-trans isomerase [Caldimonas sp.]|nr:EpsD family peptidyl-prolyl cis-trans isomerase [Caldimonas sp.]
MTTLSSPACPDSRRRPFGIVAVTIAVAASLLVGCGDKKKDKAATQTAAKVNKEEITVHQINFLLAQQRGLAPEQAASASRAALERLIDQELALQKADEQKLDRDPRVVQQVEAARREIIARAYLEKIAEGAPKPTPQEVSAYYEAHPALFKERRIYSLQELAIEAPADQVEGLKKTLASSKSFIDFVNYLKANNVRFAGNEAVRAAEQLPLASVDQFAKMKDGQAIFNVRPNGAQVINVAASRMQPVSLEQATPAIEQFLRNERKRKLLADDMQALRSAAKIEYVGDFAADAARAPYRPASAPELPPLTTIPATLPASEVKAAPQVDVAPIDTKPASMPAGATLEKGLKGFK